MQSFSFLEEIASDYWTQLDCPESLSLAIKAKAGLWTEVLTAKVVPDSYADPLRYARANAAVCFLKKNPFVGGSSDADRRANASASWWKGESSCYQANERLSPYLISPLSGDFFGHFLEGVRGWLMRWFWGGPKGDPSTRERVKRNSRLFPSDDDLKRLSRHGPGTTYSSLVKQPTAADKYSERPSLTHGAVWHLANIAGTMWGGFIAARYVSSYRDCVDFTMGNRYVSVPKTALTDRSIAIEPSLNIYFQLSVGGWIRERLRRNCGWDLDNAATVHREVARRASIDGSFATIDLSNASDSLCKNLVRVLLRDTRLLDVMEDLRSPKTFKDGKWHVLEKFSSMGNGYTFELETAIFAAICAECLWLSGTVPEFGKNLFVFGDDIIVPSDTFGLVSSALKWCGFSLNPDKSFSSGSFRESCGGDFFLGHPVRGFYMKGLPVRDSQQAFTLLNGAYQLFGTCGVNAPWFLDKATKKLVAPHLRLGGPRRLGDVVLHWPEVKRRYRWESGIRWLKTVSWERPVTIPWSFFTPEVRLACRLTSYGHAAGIDARGLRPALGVAYVSDS